MQLLHADTDKSRSASSALGSETNFGRLPRRGWCGRRSTKKRKRAGRRIRQGKSRRERSGLRYATEKEAVRWRVPQWLPRGSMVKIHTEHGVLAYIAADEGRGVEAETRGEGIGQDGGGKGGIRAGLLCG